RLQRRLIDVLVDQPGAGDGQRKANQSETNPSQRSTRLCGARPFRQEFQTHVRLVVYVGDQMTKQEVVRPSTGAAVDWQHLEWTATGRCSVVTLVRIPTADEEGIKTKNSRRFDSRHQFGENLPSRSIQTDVSVMAGGGACQIDFDHFG